MAEKTTIKLNISKKDNQIEIDGKKPFMISYNLNQRKLIAEYVLQKISENQTYNFNDFFIDGINLLKSKNLEIESRVDVPKSRNSKIKSKQILKRTTIFINISLIYWLNGYILHKIENIGTYSKYDLVKDICKIMGIKENF